MHSATQASAANRAQTLSALNQTAGERKSDISKCPMVTWTRSETIGALQSIGVTPYQLEGLDKRGVLNGPGLMQYMFYLAADPMRYVCNASNEDLTRPQYTELRDKYEDARSLRAKLPHEPGSIGARTKAGISIERAMEFRIAGLSGFEMPSQEDTFPKKFGQEDMLRKGMSPKTMLMNAMRGLLVFSAISDGTQS